MLRKIPAAVCLAYALLRGAPAWAQITGAAGPDPEKVRVHLGPVMMNPTISVTNVGIDHNVFNDPPSKAPKEDFTLTVTPLTEAWMRLGPTWLSGNMNESINWYQKYASERTANNFYRLGWLAPGTRMNFKIDGTYTNARERPGFEIDTRAAHKDINYSAAYDYSALAKTFIGVSASQFSTRFSEDAEYLGVNLRNSLNRRTLSYGVTVRHQLTPLTTLLGDVTRAEDKFEISSDRNSVSTTANVRLEFAPAALLKGNVSIGYDDYRPRDPTLPGYQGMIGNANLTYVLLGSTRFAILGGRSTRYSYDVNQPYYIQSQIGGSVAQQIFGPFDVQVRGDYAMLDYRNRIGAKVEVPDRTDRVTTVGVGIGLHLGNDLRLSFNIDQNNRDTRVIDHQYEKFLLGTSLTYGF